MHVNPTYLCPQRLVLWLTQNQRAFVFGQTSRRMMLLCSARAKWCIKRSFLTLRIASRPCAPRPPFPYWCVHFLYSSNTLPFILKNNLWVQYNFFIIPFHILICTKLDFTYCQYFHKLLCNTYLLLRRLNPIFNGNCGRKWRGLLCRFVVCCDLGHDY